MKKLILADIRKTLPFNIQCGMSLHNVQRLAEGRYNIAIDYDVYLPSKGKNLQRPFCWTLQQKQELILSVLKDIKLPAIAVIIDDNSMYQPGTDKVYRIIDGKQRLSTLISYYRNEFPIVWQGEEYYYNDLEDKAQGSIRLLNINADIAYEYSQEGDPIADDDKIAWFEQINFAGTQQDIEHLNNLKA